MAYKSSIKQKKEIGAGLPVKDEDEELPDIRSLMDTSSGLKEKRKSFPGWGSSRRKRRKRLVLVSDEEDEDDDLSDFIVQDGEDEEEKDRRRDQKRKCGREPAYLDSGSEATDDEGVVFGRRKSDQGPENGPIRALSRLLPSAKMKVSYDIPVKHVSQLIQKSST